MDSRFELLRLMDTIGEPIVSELVDFDKCEESGRIYSGAEKKIGVVYKTSPYIVKFPKYVNGVKTTSHVSEYISSMIFGLLGVSVQEVVQGFYKGSEVVAFKDFSVDGYQLCSFMDVSDSSFDTGVDKHNEYTYYEIEYLIRCNVKDTDVDTSISQFWDMYVVDALVGNFDRHKGNWGYLRYGGDNMLNCIAPVFDNASSLFPRLAEDSIDMILDSDEEMNKRTFTFPTSPILLNGEKSSYYDVITSGQFAGCNGAVERLRVSYPQNRDLIFKVIDSTHFITSKRKTFIKSILDYRFTNIFGR